MCITNEQTVEVPDGMKFDSRMQLWQGTAPAQLVFCGTAKRFLMLIGATLACFGLSHDGFHLRGFRNRY